MILSDSRLGGLGRFGRRESEKESNREKDRNEEKKTKFFQFTGCLEIIKPNTTPFDDMLIAHYSRADIVNSYVYITRSLVSRVQTTSFVYIRVCAYIYFIHFFYFASAV